MKKKKSDNPKIFTDKEVEILSEFLRENLDTSFSRKAKEYGINFEDMIRFHPLSQKIQEKRILLDLSIKDVSKQLKIPQYKLKYIENSSVKNIDIKILQDYVKLLKLDNWYKEWLKANPEFESKK
jgi:hypothetical protein